MSREWSSDAIITQARSATPLTAGSGAFVATRGLHCNADETITVQFAGDATTVNLVVAAGGVYPYRITRLMAGIGVVALY